MLRTAADASRHPATHTWQYALEHLRDKGDVCNLAQSRNLPSIVQVDDSLDHSRDRQVEDENRDEHGPHDDRAHRTLLVAHSEITPDDLVVAWCRLYTPGGLVVALQAGGCGVGAGAVTAAADTNRNAYGPTLLFDKPHVPSS